MYYSLDLDRLRANFLAAGESIHPTFVSSIREARERKGNVVREPTSVLFLCTHNSARSQMAEGILKNIGGDRVEVYSAGTVVREVHPDAIRVMAEMNIDISQQYSKHLREYQDEDFDYIITVCDRVREECPVFPGDPEQIHWSFPDPMALTAEQARYKAIQETARHLSLRLSNLLAIIEREQAGTL